MAEQWQIYRWTLGPDFNQTGGYFRYRTGYFERWDGKRIGWTPVTGRGYTRYFEGDATADKVTAAEFARLTA